MNRVENATKKSIFQYAGGGRTISLRRRSKGTWEQRFSIVIHEMVMLMKLNLPEGLQLDGIVIEGAIRQPETE